MTYTLPELGEAPWRDELHNWLLREHNSDGTHRTAWPAISVSGLATGGLGTAASPWTGWEAALSALPVDAVINFTAGHYSQSADVYGKSGWKVTGKGATIRVANSAVITAAILFTNCLNASVEDLYIDLNKANTPNAAGDTGQIGLYFYATTVAGTTASVQNVTIVNGHENGILALSSAIGTNTLELDTRNVRVSGCGNNGIEAHGLTRGTFIANICTANTISGLNLDGSKNFDIIGGRYNANLFHGVTLAPSISCTDFALIGVTANDNDNGIGGGIVVSWQCKRFRIVGCETLRNWGYGITVDPATGDGTLQRVDGTITGCTVGDSTRVGAGHGINVNYATHLSITGNTIFGNPYAGIALTGANCTVSGNVIRDNGSFGITVNYDGVSSPPMGSHNIGDNHYSGNPTNIAVSAGALNSTRFFGSERVDRLVGRGGAPTFTPGAGAGSSPPTPLDGIAGSTDMKGLVSCGTGTSPTEGAQVTVTYAQPYAAGTFPIVTLTPYNAATGTLRPYVVSTSATAFVIGFGLPPTASQPAGTYLIAYQVVG